MTVMPSDMASGAAGVPLPQQVASRSQGGEPGGGPAPGRPASGAPENSGGVDETARQPAVQDHTTDRRPAWNGPPAADATDAKTPATDPRSVARSDPAGESPDASDASWDEPGQQIDLHG